MEEYTIKNTTFVTSAVSRSDLPEELAMEIAMVGRSNVGKSSLLNSLCNNFKLAKVS
ncbi:MAG: YihA family ribosome biogenesis GTP-binding protein, partial [Clostridiales bacterium]|nr:YihA family ribosome biogenesis GTP-binding protein [Clostridiales bacterium]